MRDDILITGVSVITPIGDTPAGLAEAMIAGKSALKLCDQIETHFPMGGVVGHLYDDDIDARMAAVRAKMPKELGTRFRKLERRTSRATRYALAAAVEAWIDAGLYDAPPLDGGNGATTVFAGHNYAPRYLRENYAAYGDDPMAVDPLFALHALDTDVAASVNEVLQLKGYLATVGGACASGNLALRTAISEMRHGEADLAVVFGTIFDFSTVDYAAMTNIEAICHGSFEDQPETASRPFDVERAGFIPGHGAACMILETPEHAKARGATAHAKLLGSAACSDSNHLPNPSADGQIRCLTRALKDADVAIEAVDYVSAHATSTQLGDRTEISALREFFGDHAQKLKINAPKSLLGHVCWSASIVEGVVAIEQVKRKRLHGSANVFELDPQIDLDVCHQGPVDADIGVYLNNSFGFGGINSITVLAHPDWTR